MQKAIIVLAKYDNQGNWREFNLDEVNNLLKKGWKVISSNPMGAYGYSSECVTSDKGFCSLLVLEKNEGSN